MTKGLSKLDVAAGLLLSAFALYLTSGAVVGNAKHAGVAASVCVLLMTLPVVWRRRAAVQMAAILGFGAAFNVLVIGRMIRCGPALPALLLVAYSIGRLPERASRLATVIGLACLLASAVIQSLTDPQLDAGVVVAMTPLILGLYAVGLLVRSRTSLAAELEQRNEYLRQQRALRAELAVQADRARIAKGLEETLDSQIEAISRSARGGRLALEDGYAGQEAREAFESIQARGRSTLSHLRRLVGTLLEPDAGREPQPSLSQLDRLLSEPGSADLRLHVTGAPVVLPRGLELSAYRILEHLVRAYDDGSHPVIDVDVDFASEALSLTVSGPRLPDTDARAALVSARARVDVLGGTLITGHRPDRWETIVNLPLESGD